MSLRDLKFHARCAATVDHVESSRLHGGTAGDCRLIEGEEMLWHMLACGREITAAAGLMARRFGVYVPTMAETVIRRGRARVVMPLMFSGYIFVCVRAIERQRTRILSVPGVTGIVRINERAIIVPDAAIARIQVIEMNRLIATGLIRDVGEVARPSKQARRYRRRRERGERAPDPVEEWKIRIAPYGTLFEDDMAKIAATGEPEQRTTLLGKALGLDLAA